MMKSGASFHLTVGTKVVQELQLSWSNIAKVNRLEEEEGKLEYKMYQ